MTCSTPRFASSRSTGASFMKLGRAPTAERTRIRASVNARGGQNGRRDPREDPEDPERGFAVVSPGHDDLVARAQSHPVDRRAARDRLLQITATDAVAADTVDARPGEFRVLGWPSGRPQRIRDRGI